MAVCKIFSNIYLGILIEVFQNLLPQTEKWKKILFLYLLFNNTLYY